MFKLTLRRDQSPAKLKQDKNQLLWTRGWGGGNWDGFHCRITSGHGVCGGTCVLPRAERLSLHSVVKKTPCEGFSHFCGCCSFSCSGEGRSKRVLASVSWGTLPPAPTCRPPEVEHAVWLPLVQWPHWALSQVKQEAFTSLCRLFQCNIAWVSFYLSNPTHKGFTKKKPDLQLSGCLSPLVHRPQTSASLRALNETWHHSVEKQDNRHHCGQGENAYFTERLPTASILSCTSNATHSLKAPCLLPSGSGFSTSPTLKWASSSEVKCFQVRFLIYKLVCKWIAQL